MVSTTKHVANFVIRNPSNQKSLSGKEEREGTLKYYESKLGIVSVGFDVTDQLQIRSFAFVRYWRKNGSTMRQYISYS
jgi:hypothetical protein